jgi:uncharacterized protein (UPF0335 family)
MTENNKAYEGEDDNKIIITFDKLTSKELSNKDKKSGYENNDAMVEELKRCDKDFLKRNLFKYIIRIEEYEGKISDINNEKKSVFHEMKGVGICVEAVKEIIKERKKSREHIENIKIDKDEYEKILYEDC